MLQCLESLGARSPRVLVIAGVPRSGSTWVARVLSACLAAPVIHEPFNWRHHPEHEWLHLRYVPGGTSCTHLDQALCEAVERRLGEAARGDCPGWLVLKDVHASFAIPYIADCLCARVAVTCRHPCAVAASWSRLGYAADFRIQRLLCQEHLISSFLHPYVNHLRSRKDYFFQIGALWGGVYEYLDRAIDVTRTAVWWGHEAACNRPVAAFSETLRCLGAPVDGVLMDALRRTNTHSDDPYTACRMVRNEREKWKNVLSQEAIKQVIDGAAAFSVFHRRIER